MVKIYIFTKKLNYLQNTDSKHEQETVTAVLLHMRHQAVACKNPKIACATLEGASRCGKCPTPASSWR